MTTKITIINKIAQVKPNEVFTSIYQIMVLCQVVLVEPKTSDKLGEEANCFLLLCINFNNSFNKKYSNFGSSNLNGE